MYGLKQSGRNWNDLLDQFFKSLNFKQSLTDACLYTKYEGHSVIILLVWVDDLLICSNDATELARFKSHLSKRFSMKDLGRLNWFLGIEFKFEEDCIKMSQSNFILKLLDRFQMSNCNPKSLPCDVNVKMSNLDSLLPSHVGQSWDLKCHF